MSGDQHFLHRGTWSVAIAALIFWGTCALEQTSAEAACKSVEHWNSATWSNLTPDGLRPTIPEIPDCLEIPSDSDPLRPTNIVVSIRQTRTEIQDIFSRANNYIREYDHAKLFSAPELEAMTKLKSRLDEIWQTNVDARNIDGQFIQRISSGLRNVHVLATIQSIGDSIPACHDADMLNNLKQVIDNGPYGRNFGMRLIDVTEVVDQTDSPKVRSCVATGYFNVGKKSIRYTIEEMQSGRLYVEVKLIN